MQGTQFCSDIYLYFSVAMQIPIDYRSNSRTRNIFPAIYTRAYMRIKILVTFACMKYICICLHVSQLLVYICKPQWKKQHFFYITHLTSIFAHCTFLYARRNCSIYMGSTALRARKNKNDMKHVPVCGAYFEWLNARVHTFTLKSQRENVRASKQQTTINKYAPLLNAYAYMRENANVIKIFNCLRFKHAGA